MAMQLRMPDMGTVEGEVTLVRWLKSEGESVSLGEPLFEVETDKGVSEVESAAAGVLVRRLTAEGTKVAAGAAIAIIRRPGDSPADDDKVAEGASHSGAAGQPAGKAPAGPQGRSPGGERAESAAARISPVVRALAERWGVDIAMVTATGPGGQVTREDVRKARDKAAGSAAGGQSSPQPVQGAPTGARRSSHSLSKHQASVARAVSKSHQEKPVFHVSLLVDLAKAADYRRAQGAAAVKYDALFVKAVATAISEFPVFRSRLVGDEVVDHDGIDVAVAVGIGDELYAPAVRGAREKSPQEISRDIESLAAKAKSHVLASSDVEGSCLLVSNLGMFGIDAFDAVIYPEHSAALAVGAIVKTPVADDKGTRVASLARLTLSVDHRLINGTTAARFLARVKEVLETGDFA